MNGEEITVKTVISTTTLKEKYLYSFDINYLNMICDRDEIDLLLIPKVNDNKTSLFVYQRNSEDLSEITNINSIDTDSFEILISLMKYFPLNETEQLNSSNSIVLFSDDPIKVDCSNTVADVYINGEKVGNTPYIINEYSLPFTLELKADGYSSRITNVNSTTNNDISIELKEIFIDSVENYRNSKTKFYQAFSNSLILFGINAATRALIPRDNKAYRTTNIVLQSLISASLIDTGYRLFNYYKNGQKLVP